MSTQGDQGVDLLNNREKEIYRTLDVFSHGVSHSEKGYFADDNNPEVHETSHADYNINSQPSILKIVSKQEEDDQANNNNITECGLSQHELLNLQTGAKLYHGDGGSVSIEEEEADEVEESIQRFLAVPDDVPSFTSGDRANDSPTEVICFLWYPDDSRVGICEEALQYLRRGLGCRGVRLKEDRIDLSFFKVDFPILIFCLPPPHEPSRLSLGDMPVALVIIHQDPLSHGNLETPLADDLYWRRYRNLSLILDLMTSRGIFHNTRTNCNCISRLFEFLRHCAPPGI